VRVHITSAPNPDKPLRLGASATVTIDTTEPAQGQQ
jgi:multidrug resistance efflux pump